MSLTLYIITSVLCLLVSALSFYEMTKRAIEDEDTLGILCAVKGCIYLVLSMVCVYLIIKE